MIYRLKIRDGHGSGNVSHYLDEVMTDMGLNAPKKGKINPRCRFYFTDEGWDKVGRRLYSFVRNKGFPVGIERRKNPKRSDICYQDKLQVAILP